jgi:AcrR family transcriptional regulator
MRKGEESRKRIIDAAEKLFGEKGFQATSVQDVLDALGISKGGFYHYFETKMELLTAVCNRRAEAWYRDGVAYVRAMRAGAVEKMNAALRLVSAIDRETPAMFGEITRLTLSAQDASVRSQLRLITLETIAPLLEEIIDAGVREKQFSVRRAGEMARIITLLALDVNEEASREIAQRYEDPDCALNILEFLATYREAIETILNAPHGSMELFDFGDMISAVGRIVMDLKGAGRAI